MRPLELLLLAGLGPLLALAMDDIESNDFPISCRPACQPAVDLSERVSNIRCSLLPISAIYPPGGLSLHFYSSVLA